MRLDASARRRGSALILVLWCLILLGLAVFGVVDMVELSVDQTSHENLVTDARALAFSGLALGLNSQLLRTDPLLSQTPAPGREFKATVQSEGARLNLNFVLLSGHREILENLFTYWGLSLDQAGHCADCLFDWITPGDLKSLNGAKGDDYARAGLPQRPTGKPFLSMSEVEQVMGMDALEKVKPTWRESFTLWSSGPLNVNEAEPALIAAVFGLDAKRVEPLTTLRDGRDGIPGTVDDVTIPDLKTVQSQLGIGDLTMKTLGAQISFDDPNRRVKSVGAADGVQVTISAVTHLNSSPIQYLLWSEQ